MQWMKNDKPFFLIKPWQSLIGRSFPVCPPNFCPENHSTWWHTTSQRWDVAHGIQRSIPGHHAPLHIHKQPSCGCSSCTGCPGQREDKMGFWLPWKTTSEWRIENGDWLFFKFPPVEKICGLHQLRSQWVKLYIRCVQFPVVPLIKMIEEKPVFQTVLSVVEQHMDMYLSGRQPYFFHIE